ncbi:hypothetical protein AB205_0076460 [Aquarana catesbeiana]|uniref:Uncharacterized protein n=1 Tax=Aquarana catesbeiana TaxID=8400 RepID=A0A2G9S7E1_AQUCT|nr:hypothetical protein AB205_0076460 [Aquarana catesbeiana]
MKECRAVQAEMLATLQSFRATVEKWQEAPSTRESSPSQDGTSASYTGGSQGLAPYSDEKEAEALDQNSRKDGEDSDLANLIDSLITERTQAARAQEDVQSKALGCSVDVADVSCKCFLDDLVGLFRFYNGPLWHAYQVRSQAELNEEWNLYLEHMQNTPELHQIFNSLSHLDKTKVWVPFFVGLSSPGTD